MQQAYQATAVVETGSEVGQPAQLGAAAAVAADAEQNVVEEIAAIVQCLEDAQPLG